MAKIQISQSNIVDTICTFDKFSKIEITHDLNNTDISKKLITI